MNSRKSIFGYVRQHSLLAKYPTLRRLLGAWSTPLIQPFSTHHEIFLGQLLIFRRTHVLFNREGEMSSVSILGREMFHKRNHPSRGQSGERALTP